LLLEPVYVLNFDDADHNLVAEEETVLVDATVGYGVDNRLRNVLVGLDVLVGHFGLDALQYRYLLEISIPCHKSKIAGTINKIFSDLLGTAKLGRRSRSRRTAEANYLWWSHRCR